MGKRLDMEAIQRIEADMLRTIDRICTEHDVRYYLAFGSMLGAVRHGGPIPWDNDVDITVPYPELPAFCETMKRELAHTKYRICIPGDMSIRGNITVFPRIALRNVDPQRLHVDVFPQIGITSDEEEQRKFMGELAAINRRHRERRTAEAKLSVRMRPLVRNILKKLWLRVKTHSDNADELLREFWTLCARYDYDSSEYVTTPCGCYGLKNILPKAWFGRGIRVPYVDMQLPVPEKTEEYLRHYYGDYTQYPPRKEREAGLRITVEVDDSFRE